MLNLFPIVTTAKTAKTQARQGVVSTPIEAYIDVRNLGQEARLSYARHNR